MPLLPCPECGKKLKVSDDIEPGKRVRCKDCGEMFRVPDEEEDEDEEEDAPRSRKKASRDEDENEDRPAKRSRRSDEDDEDEEEEDKRPRKPKKKPKKKKQGSKAGLIIVLSIVGVLLITGGIVVAVGVSKGWFGKGDSSSSASTKDSSSSKDKDKDGSKGPPPVQATGEVKVIPRNIVDQLIGLSGKKMTLAEVEAKLGGAGRQLAGAELEEAFQKMPTMRDSYNGWPGATCVRWTSGKTTLLCVFSGGECVGGQVK
jgi:hypothetical protein